MPSVSVSLLLLPTALAAALTTALAAALVPEVELSLWSVVVIPVILAAARRDRHQ